MDAMIITDSKTISMVESQTNNKYPANIQNLELVENTTLFCKAFTHLINGQIENLSDSEYSSRLYQVYTNRSKQKYSVGAGV